MSLTINGLNANSMRWLASWSGLWSAELDIKDLIVPSGKAAIVSTEGFALAGTVDDDHSGSFGEKQYVRVVGGAGWMKPVRKQHFHSDVGLQLSVLASATATEVGEVAIVLLPQLVGTDFTRVEGPASQVFVDANVDWWVGLDGVTRVGIRPPIPQPLSLEVLDWDPSAHTVSFKADVLVEPGTVIVDDRFGKRVVREVEAIVSGGSVTGTLVLADSPPPIGTESELVEALASLARSATRAKFGRVYEYRVIEMAGDRAELQSVKPVDGVPDVLPVSIWAGISGYRGTLKLTSRVLVGFIAGDPRQPYVAAYEPPEADGWRPIKLELDADAAVAIGEMATAVVIGQLASAKPLVRLTPTFATWIAAVTAALNSLAPGSAVAPTDLASTKVVSS